MRNRDCFQEGCLKRSVQGWQVGIALPSLDDALAARKEQEMALIDKGFSGGGENHTIWMEKDSKAVQTSLWPLIQNRCLSNSITCAHLH